MPMALSATDFRQRRQDGIRIISRRHGVQPSYHHAVKVSPTIVLLSTPRLFLPRMRNIVPLFDDQLLADEYVTISTDDAACSATESDENWHCEGIIRRHDVVLPRKRILLEWLYESSPVVRYKEYLRQGGQACTDTGEAKCQTTGREVNVGVHFQQPMQEGLR